MIDEEAEDDILKLGGVSADDTFVPALQTSMKRLPWLGVNLFTALIGRLRHRALRGDDLRLVALATLMPMVAGMGGNAGTQALTVTVRSLAAGEITRGNAWRAMRKGMAVGLLQAAPFWSPAACWRCCSTASPCSPPCSAPRCWSTSWSPGPPRRHHPAGPAPPGPGPRRGLQRVPHAGDRRGGISWRSWGLPACSCFRGRRHEPRRRATASAHVDTFNRERDHPGNTTLLSGTYSPTCRTLALRSALLASAWNLRNSSSSHPVLKVGIQDAAPGSAEARRRWRGSGYVRTRSPSAGWAPWTTSPTRAPNSSGEAAKMKSSPVASSNRVSPRSPMSAHCGCAA